MWTPPEGTVIDIYEDESLGVTQSTISFSLGAVSDYSTSDKDSLVYTLGSTLEIKSSGFFKKIPVEYIRYTMPDKSKGECLDFDNIPNGATGIYGYQRSSSSPVILELNVFAKSINELGIEEEVSASYSINLHANYTTGKDKLLAEIEKRR